MLRGLPLASFEHRHLELRGQKLWPASPGPGTTPSQACMPRSFHGGPRHQVIPLERKNHLEDQIRNPVSSHSDLITHACVEMKKGSQRTLRPGGLGPIEDPSQPPSAQMHGARQHAQQIICPARCPDLEETGPREGPPIARQLLIHDSQL